jgi:hypothetical protein
MDLQLFIICALTFVIHLIGTLAYSVRIAGVRTRRIAISFSMFNILILLSRTSNTFQAPYLAKRIEGNLAAPGEVNLQSALTDFQWLLFSATLATIVGAFLIPTCQRFFSKAVIHFQVHRSMPKLFLHCITRSSVAQVKDISRMPALGNITQLKMGGGISPKIITMNVLAVALWTVGVFASLYAGYLNPEVRVTSSTLSAIINGFSTIMMFVFIDPHISMMTDDVVEGKLTESQFRSSIVWLVGSRLAGTLLAQALIVPAAHVIVYVAELM